MPIHEIPVGTPLTREMQDVLHKALDTIEMPISIIDLRGREGDLRIATNRLKHSLEREEAKDGQEDVTEGAQRSA